MSILQTKIDLLGNPPVWNLSTRTQKFVMRRDMQSVAFALVAGELALKASANKAALSEAMLVGGILVLNNAMSLLASWWFESGWLQSNFGIGNIFSKYIDKNPDTTRPYNLHLWRVQAAELRQRHANGLKLSLGLSAVSVGILAYGDMYPMLYFAPALVRQYQGWRRWSNVERGKWRVIDKSSVDLSAG